MAKFGAFHDARNYFMTSTGFSKPLTFEEWKAKPDDLKAGLLFVQFYNEITLAWDKADSRDFGEPEEGVETILQYLEKQVRQIQYYRKDDPKKKATAEYRRQNPDGYIEKERRIIEENPSKFSPGYIYRTAYNCLYCICGHDRKCDKDRMDNETSSIVTYDGKELDLFDTIIDRNGAADVVAENQSFEQEFWRVIEESGAEAEKVMRYILSQDAQDLKKLSTRSKNYEGDPLRDVEVSLDAVDRILAELRERFLNLPANSVCGQMISEFDAVFA